MNNQEVWNLLRDKKRQPVPDIGKDSFYEHFKELSNPKCDNQKPDSDIEEYNKAYEEGKLEHIYEELNVQLMDKEV